MRLYMAELEVKAWKTQLNECITIFIPASRLQ